MSELTEYQYKQIFKREMYHLIHEDYEDSFTPGGFKHKKGELPVVIPITYYREKAHIVEAKLAREGKKKPHGLNIEKMAKELFTPHGQGDDGDYQANPSTPKIPKAMFDDLKFFNEFFGKDAMRANPTITAGPDELMRQFKSATSTISGLFLRQRLKLKESDYDFHEGASAIDMRRAIANQYRRYYVELVTANLIRKVYEITPDDIDQFLKEVGFESKPTQTLKLSLIRRQFSKGVTHIMETIFGKFNLGKTILGQVRHAKSEKPATTQEVARLK
jgi:hypothetical protein